MIICPDTSPRGLDLPNEHESFDFGSGAGFYVDATSSGYKDHDQIYSYVSPVILEKIRNCGMSLITVSYLHQEKNIRPIS